MLEPRTACEVFFQYYELTARRDVASKLLKSDCATGDGNVAEYSKLGCFIFNGNDKEEEMKFYFPVTKFPAF